ncbi:MAG: ligand-binding sensor domain-containing protein [Gammaproteobacteria bacterium]|jgi:ligand-binding sensor domain-containing protein
MRQRIYKKLQHSGISCYFLFIFLLFFISCNGQENKNLGELKIESSKGDSSNLKAPWVDPLFFIDGQLCQHLRKIFQDSKGNLWFGTNNYDIMKYDGHALKYFTKDDGLNNGRITGIVEDSIGNVWFGTSKGLAKFNGKSFTTYTEKDGLLNDEIWSLIIDENGIFWIGTNDGLSRFDGNHFTTISIPKGEVEDANTIYALDRITGIAEDKKGNLWFGTDGFGICKYDGETFTNFTMANGLCDNTIHELMADSKGNLWIGTYWGGICKYDGKTFTNFTKDGVISGLEVSGFFEDNNGDIWFAVENNGVYSYNGQSFRNFNKEDGLVTNGILAIYKDKENRFWFGGWGGLFRYDGESFFSVTKDGPWTN